MPLRSHLVELRNRIIVAAIAVLAFAVAGWFFYEPVVSELTRPIRVAAAINGQKLDLRFGAPTESFDWKIKLSIWLGVIAASPVWIYQLWAFITPGLTKKERWYATGFLAASVPLFLSGVGLAWLVLPNAFIFLTAINPDEVSAIYDFGLYLNFVTRVALGFGIAFLLPVVLVALNMSGLMSARTMFKGWRVAIVASFVFAAIASPTPDIIVMFSLAAPIVGLYWVAVGIAVLNDRRRARRDGTAGLDDDEASEIDDDAASRID